MLFEFIIIRETSEKIWEQAKKVYSEEAVRESVAFLYSRLLTIDWFLVWLRKLRQFDLFSYK